MSDKVIRTFLDMSVPGGRLWVCRGPGKCTARHPEIRKLRCPDCYLPRDEQTLGEVAEHLVKGDA